VPLLDGDFIRELEVLKRHLDLQVRSGQAGDRAARRRGSSTEFADHRNYVPGDDLRRLDWFAFGRTGTPVLKQYRAEEDACVRVLVDHSASMGLGTPPKLSAAKRLTGALAYLWLTSGQRFQLLGERPSSEPGARAAPLESTSLRAFPTRRGQRAIAASFEQISALSAGGGTDVSSWVRSLSTTARRSGLLVVVSDFLDAGTWLGSLDLALSRGHEVALVQVLSPEELNPSLEGDLQLVDCETGQLVEVSIDSAALDAYAKNLNDLTTSLAKWARKRGQRFVRISSDGDWGVAVRTLATNAPVARPPTQRSPHK
jgi:uncharacterized protein (DUF58 family)